ncbi:MAG: TIGR02266 family protein [Myxococcota bacterium]
MARVSMEAEDAHADVSREGGIRPDRRRSERAPITVRIDYATVDELFSEFTRDINEGGLFIETDQPPDPGTEVTMQFRLPGSGEALKTVGRVVRVTPAVLGRPGGMGIEFDELTPDDRRRIDQIVRNLRAHDGV